MRSSSLAILLSVFAFAGCDSAPANKQNAGGSTQQVIAGDPNLAKVKTLAEAREGFKTQITKQEKTNEPVDVPPPKLFGQVEYPSAVGNLAAYLTPDPKDGKKHPAIIWITGGDCSSIGDVWKPLPPANDQTASAFRKAGIVMMFPSLRGGNKNPGFHEGFYGEVDDVVAAFDYLAKIDYVDASRIYLGGHSTGGTLVLLVSEFTDKFRAVFSFGPLSDVRGYDEDYKPKVDANNPKELDLRSPLFWLHGIKKPTFVIEGAVQGNGKELAVLSKASKNPEIKFLAIPRRDHFSVLVPATQVLAAKILTDTEEKCNIAVTVQEVILGKAK